MIGIILIVIGIVAFIIVVLERRTKRQTLYVRRCQTCKCQRIGVFCSRCGEPDPVMIMRGGHRDWENRQFAEKILKTIGEGKSVALNQLVNFEKSGGIVRNIRGKAITPEQWNDIAAQISDVKSVAISKLSDFKVLDLPFSCTASGNHYYPSPLDANGSTKSNFWLAEDLLREVGYGRSIGPNDPRH